jgi:hypothetical protein
MKNPARFERAAHCGSLDPRSFGALRLAFAASITKVRARSQSLLAKDRLEFRTLLGADLLALLPNPIARAFAAQARREAVRELLDVQFPDAGIVRLVMGDLNTHSLGSLYEAFEPSEARRLAKRWRFTTRRSTRAG